VLEKLECSQKKNWRYGRHADTLPPIPAARAMKL
jgi:hypothetical protein